MTCAASPTSTTCWVSFTHSSSSVPGPSLHLILHKPCIRENKVLNLQDQGARQLLITKRKRNIATVDQAPYGLLRGLVRVPPAPILQDILSMGPLLSTIYEHCSPCHHADKRETIERQSASEHTKGTYDRIAFTDHQLASERESKKLDTHPSHFFHHSPTSAIRTQRSPASLGRSSSRPWAPDLCKRYFLSTPK